MNLYQTQIERELYEWRESMQRQDGAISGTAKEFQVQSRKLIPHRVQGAITATIKTLTDAVMYGSRFVTGFGQSTADLTLAESDYLVMRQFRTYRTAAVSEGALTGAGGFLLGFADLPALLGLKLKFLFDCAELYGCNVNDPEERLFILHVFQLAFSSRSHRLECLRAIESWDSTVPHSVDWERFQTEYRDCLDTAKMLQLIPLVGAPIGAIANNSLMERLRECAMNSYRLRKLRSRLPVNSE